MKKIKALEAIKKDQLLRIFVKAKEIVTNKSYKYLQGMFYANDILIIDVSENNSILIDFSDNTIQLVDSTVFTSRSYDAQAEITILNKFFTEFLDLVEKIEARGFLTKIIDIINNLCKPKPKSVDLFFNVERWYYKSLLSSLIASYCFREDGQYQFDLPNNKVLHVYISRVYMTDEGIYFIQKIRDGISFYVDEVDCKQEILNACKYLTSNEALLKPK